MPATDDAASLQAPHASGQCLDMGRATELDGAPGHLDGAPGHQARPRPHLNGAARCRNKMLAALPPDTWERLSPQLCPVLLIDGDVVQESGSVIEHIYFVESGLVSLVVVSGDGIQVEFGMLGREGMSGAMGLMGGGRSFHRSVIQVAGKAYRLPVGTVREEVQRCPVLREMLYHYLSLQTAQAAQSAFCNRVHTVEERLSRWLLTIRDRIESNEIDITHEFISHMLGVRRSGVTVALGVLQQAGLVDLSRGHISICNVEGMGQSACECLPVLREQFKHYEEWLATP